MEKYHALIKNWKQIVKFNKYATVQFCIAYKDTSSQYLSLSEIDSHEPLTMEEWLNFNITNDNAFLISDDNFELLLSYL